RRTARPVVPTWQQPKQSQPLGVRRPQVSRQAWLCVENLSQCTPGGSVPALHWVASARAGSQRRSNWHASAPELPSKKQSWWQDDRSSLLSPGIPVANVPSSLSQAPEHSGSAESILPSPSLSMPSVHCE